VGWVGCEAANFAKRDNKVTIVEMLNGIALDHGTRQPGGSVGVVRGTACGGGVQSEQNLRKRRHRRGREGNCAASQGDRMVIALGAEPVRDLVGPFKGARCPVTGNWR